MDIHRAEDCFSDQMDPADLFSEVVHRLSRGFSRSQVNQLTPALTNLLWALDQVKP